jgi:RNase P subunit RPR2
MPHHTEDMICPRCCAELEADKHRLRMPGEPNWSTSCRCGCGQTFARFDRSGRPRDYLSGHNLRRVGKKAAGRLLDGVEHNGIPETRP